ncbi:MAG: hypothetical protein Q9159_001175 [Coniocarpon cinnabarinum]
MAPSSVHLPNGQTLTVTPVFGGLSFRPNELALHKSTFPPGWTVMLSEEDDESDGRKLEAHDPPLDTEAHRKQHHVHRYKRPTLRNDHMFISAISNPSTNEYKPPVSQTRQIAMMLWSTLWWYFHQPEPEPHMLTKACENTVHEGRPKGEWIININREGIFGSATMLTKLTRMGLITCEDSSVGLSTAQKYNASYHDMFVSRRAFWQMDPRIFLFTLEPVPNSAIPAAVGTPISSRPGSPNRATGRDSPSIQMPSGAQSPGQFGPFASSSHLPTYYPPHPTQFTFTNGIRHPIRPKPFRQGETFYCRYVPSVGQYLSFRVASISSKAPSRQGPWSIQSSHSLLPSLQSRHASLPDTIVSSMGSLDLDVENDLQLLHKWMNDPRVSHSWGEQGPERHQEEFLKQGLQSKHSFPVIGCWDGKPFGFFEIYWVKEDRLGMYLGGAVDDWDRGLHVLVGEQEFRGPNRVRIWLSALIHFCWLADMRTNTVMMEPRVDNAKLLNYCQELGFFKEGEVTFPHKQSNVLKVRRTTWEKPVT